ncbi:MAG TPA: hypothetical protein VMM80_08630, partial [Bacteroidota bacterium]|nr:hypothetical protein [Bacteroidota bacterium]
PGREPDYDAKADLARIAMKSERPAAAIDPFRIWFESDGTGAVLSIGWADRVYTARVAAH